MKTNKPIITKINLSEDKMKELKTLLDRKGTYGRVYKKNAIKYYLGGVCFNCSDIPTIKVTYDVSDSEMKAQRIERYCDECFEKNKDKVHLTATNGIDETIAIRESELKRLN
jgi:ribosomal protein L10